MAALSWSVPFFVEDRMIGAAHVELMDNGGLLIQAGSTEDPEIHVEDLPHMSGYSLILQSAKNSTPKHDCSPNYCCCGPDDMKPPRADPTVWPEGKEGLDGPKQ